MIPARLTHWTVLLVAALAGGCLGTENSVNVYAGSRSLESDDWDEVDEPTVYGADVALKLSLPWTSVEGGWLYSEDDASSAGGLTDVDVELNEYFIGLRIVPWKILIEPYGAAGISWVEGDFEGDNGGVPTGDSDSVFGYYVRLGAAIHIAMFRLGLDGRASFSEDMDLEAIETDADSYQLAAFIGINF
jgi:outer membrane protein with beta-barrel domain